MISWEQNTLWITSLSTWEGISFLDYEAAYRAMVEKRMCHDWVKVVDLSQFVSSKTDLSTLKASKTRKRIADLNWWSANNGMRLQVVIVGSHVKPQVLQDLKEIYLSRDIQTEFVSTSSEAYRLISNLKIAV
ncbi:hypothetical protein [Marinobacter salsuginis]|jgi:hypothetical protein|uniref:STAS domain-containing protein n=1 Tax=Marinobacter salsuginis TaxID=418719 RepID=A0A5M3Q5D9_9GAMM|nr:hypothetical protein [Marinobacter salsuginis]GBO90493.1 hypothetical protein MSSD14B_41610 [Marinobacter salsuginis]